MQTYEFNADVSGGVIQIPEQYRNRGITYAKVIILSSITDTKKNGRRKFSAMKLKTKGFKFNREEANAR